MSNIEETLERIRNAQGIQGFVIVDENGKVIRQSAALPRTKAELYGKLINKLYMRGLHVVRDLNPLDDLKYLRLRGQKSEVLVAPGMTQKGTKFAVIVIQDWKATGESA